MAPRSAIPSGSSVICVLKETKSSSRAWKACYNGRNSPCPTLLKQSFLESSSSQQSDHAFRLNLFLKPSRIDVPIVQNKAKILTLPNELISAILLDSPNVNTAKALSQTCRVFYKEYKYNEKKILYQSLLCEMGPDILAEALIVHRVRSIDFPDYRNDAENHVSRYTKGDFRHPKLGNLTVKDMRQIVKHRRQFQDLASYFEAQLLKNLNPELFSAAPSYQSLLESICWRLYQLQHYSELFTKFLKAQTDGTLDWDLVERSKLFLKLMPAAQIKEPVDVGQELLTEMWRNLDGIPKKFVRYDGAGGLRVSLFLLAVYTWKYHIS